MIHAVSADSADELWRKAVRIFRNRDRVHTQDSRCGPTRELLHVGLSLRDPRQRWIVSRAPALNPAFAVAEVVWILTGRNDSAFLNFWNTRLPRFAGTGPVYYGAYGHRIRRHLGIDQLEMAFDALKNNPASRQVVLQIWDSRQDLPDAAGRPRDPDIPCNTVSMLKVRDGKLEWLQVVRSNDLFLGLPHNIVQFTFLQEAMAGWLGLELGSYDQISDSLHLYEHDARVVLDSKPARAKKNSDSIAVPKTESDICFREVAARVDTLIQDDLSRDGITSLAEWPEAPQAFQNMLTLLCAEVARRRHWHDLATGLMEKNSNPVYGQLWSRWVDRLSNGRSGRGESGCSKDSRVEGKYKDTREAGQRI